MTKKMHKSTSNIIYNSRNSIIKLAKNIKANTANSKAQNINKALFYLTRALLWLDKELMRSNSYEELLNTAKKEQKSHPSIEQKQDIIEDNKPSYLSHLMPKKGPFE